MMTKVNWVDKTPGYYVIRHNAKGEPTGYLTPQGGWSLRRGQATMFETESGAMLAAQLRSNSFLILANRTTV